jgi:hypothetical protein
MSERIFEALAIVALNGFGKDIKSCAYLDKSTYEDPYFLNTLGDNAYGLLKGAAAVEDTARMAWILDHGRMPKLPLGWLIKWCIDKRFQNSAIWLMARFDLPQEDSFIWTVADMTGFHPLVEACRSSQTKLAMWLLDHGVNPNCHTFYDPLSLTVKTHNVGLFKMLIAKGADVNFEDANGFTAPWRAVMWNVDTIFDHCLARGYYDKEVTAMGRTVNSKNIIKWAYALNNTYAAKRLEALQVSLGVV